MIHPLVFDLLSTLTAANLDWLAEEVLHGLLVGDIPLETRDAIIGARDSVFRTSQNNGGFDVEKAEQWEPRLFTEEEQIHWAIDHVSRRLGDALAMMMESVKRLDDLVDRSDQVIISAQKKVSVQLVLMSGEEAVGESGIAQLAAAQEELLALESALANWLSHIPPGDPN